MLPEHYRKRVSHLLFEIYRVSRAQVDFVAALLSYPLLLNFLLSNRFQHHSQVDVTTTEEEDFTVDGVSCQGMVFKITRKAKTGQGAQRTS